MLLHGSAQINFKMLACLVIYEFRNAQSGKLDPVEKTHR
jgi:hypothetical protein